MFLKLTLNDATALWNPNCGEESVNGINEHIIRNSVKNSVEKRVLMELMSILYGIPSKIPCFTGYVISA